MAGNDILMEYGASTPLPCTLASLGNGSARQAAQVLDASPCAARVRVYYKLTTGTSPTSGSLIEFYLSRADDDASEHADGATGTGDAAYSGNVDQLELVHTQPVTNASDTAYLGSFVLDDPGPDWRLVVKNATGVALNSTSGNHYLRYRAVSFEAQPYAA
jgi:hypothetical protein